ncbi:MAG: homoserine dehydrogenase [Desulfonauticus sp.]|nr:homoserine dehydrogenase [Desulfonauticus sp.]
MKEVVKIALAGFGTVGTGLVKILMENKDWIKRRTGKEIIVSQILVKNLNKPRPIIPQSEPIFTNNVDEFLQNKDWDILVELIGGLELPYQIISKAILFGKHVVTANKALLAIKGKELLQLANAKNVGLYFEASVGGGIPIVQTLKESLCANKVTSISGILNGTANYILTEMSQQGLSFDLALKQAQEKGYAEADPALDIDGIDAAHKLVILIFLAYGEIYPFEKLWIKGIKQVDLLDINFAKELGYILKLIAQVQRESNGLRAGVFPAFFPNNHILSKVDGAFNAILVQGNATGPVVLCGQGAGDLPTGSSVLADIISLIKHNSQINNTGFKDDPFQQAKCLDFMDWECKHYFRFQVKDKPGVLSSLSGVMGEYNISIAQAIQKTQTKTKQGVPIVFLSHRAKLKQVTAAINKINEFDFILEPTIHYPIIE